MNLKMSITSKIFGKLCLKFIIDTFFQYVVCNQGRDWMKHEEKREDSGSSF